MWSGFLHGVGTLVVLTRLPTRFPAYQLTRLLEERTHWRQHLVEGDERFGLHVEHALQRQ